MEGLPVSYRKDHKGSLAIQAASPAEDDAHRHGFSKRVETAWRTDPLAQEGIPQQFVLVVRSEDGSTGVRYCEGAEEAQASVEALLDAGCDRACIELFQAYRVPFAVSFRPVVELGTGQN